MTTYAAGSFADGVKLEAELNGSQIDMTEEELREEGAEEAIEDLEAPAAAQEDVAGGRALCGPKSCGHPSLVCQSPTCTRTVTNCSQLSQRIDIYAA